MTDAGALVIIYMISIMLLFFQRTQKSPAWTFIQTGLWEMILAGEGFGSKNIAKLRDDIYFVVKVWKSILIPEYLIFVVKKANVCKEIRQKHRFLGAFVRDIFFVLYRWSWWWESNPQPSHYEWDALPLSHISNLACLFYHEFILPSSTEHGKHGNDGGRSAWCRMKASPKAVMKAR